MSTINFACRQIPVEQVIRCGFGINKTEYRILKFLLSKDEDVDINHIAEKIGKDRTTTQRAVKKLVSSGLVFRRQFNITSGGFQYYYKVKSKHEIKEKAYQNFYNWRELVEKELKKW